jgi:hypothetical protein
MGIVLRWALLASCVLAGAAGCQPVTIGAPARAGGSTGNPDDSKGHDDDELPSAGGTDGGSMGGAGGTPHVGGGTVGGDSAGGEPGLAGENQGGEPQGGTASCTLTLRGHVTVPRGATVTGMKLTLSGDAYGSTRSGVDGEYAFDELCPGSYTVTPSCGSSAVTLELDSDQALDFVNAAGGCEPDVVEPRVLIVNFDPSATPPDVNPPQRLSGLLGLGAAADGIALQMLDTITAATNGHVRPNGRRVVGNFEFPPLVGGFRYTPETFAACLKSPTNCRSEAIDYAAVDLEQGLCDIVQSENIDQVWAYGVDQFNMPRVGALTCQLWVAGSWVTEVLDVFGLRYDRGLSSFLAEFQAAAEAELSTVFPNVPGDPVNNPYGLFQQACGGVNRAPNSKQLGRFDDPATVQSFCDAFLSSPVSPPLPLKSLSCGAWGCTEDGFRRYWFSRLPRARWFDSLGRPNDYWRSVLLNRHVAVPDVGVTCSSSSERGGCERVRDGGHGTCAFGEWAPASPTSSWVEYQFSPPREVTGVALYDRACDGRVLAGHLEFSDGSQAIPFEALEDTGETPLELGFAPKLLSGLRVYIDQTSGYTPGLGEVSLTFAP